MTNDATSNEGLTTQDVSEKIGEGLANLGASAQNALIGLVWEHSYLAGVLGGLEQVAATGEGLTQGQVELLLSGVDRSHQLRAATGAYLFSQQTASARLASASMPAPATAPQEPAQVTAADDEDWGGLVDEPASETLWGETGAEGEPVVQEPAFDQAAADRVAQEAREQALREELADQARASCAEAAGVAAKLSLAQAVKDRMRARTGVEEIALGLHLLDELGAERSQEIADRAGVSRTTVGRWAQAAEDIAVEGTVEGPVDDTVAESSDEAEDVAELLEGSIDEAIEIEEDQAAEHAPADLEETEDDDPAAPESEAGSEWIDD